MASKYRCTQKRYIQIQATPSSREQSLRQRITSKEDNTTAVPDAQFEVLGDTSSLLSATISASQPLYTRRGTLVAFTGDAENTTSKLSVLEPIRRVAGGIPFLYQKITSTSPFDVLIGAKSTGTSHAVVHMDGRLDWMIAQRNALLAWTGHTLSLTPIIKATKNFSQWGSTSVTGRGLLCLAGKGRLYQVTLETDQTYTVHPSNIIAYAMMRHLPQPFRFKTSALRLQVPDLQSRLPETRFAHVMRQSSLWRIVANLSYAIRTWYRRIILGDRLFLHFVGPANIILQSRGNSVTELMSTSEANEAADMQPGTLRVSKAELEEKATHKGAAIPLPTKITYAEVKSDGKVQFETPKST